MCVSPYLHGYGYGDRVAPSSHKFFSPPRLNTGLGDREQQKGRPLLTQKAGRAHTNKRLVPTRALLPSIESISIRAPPRCWLWRALPSYSVCTYIHVMGLPCLTSLLHYRCMTGRAPLACKVEMIEPCWGGVPFFPFWAIFDGIPLSGGLNPRLPRLPRLLEGRPMMEHPLRLWVYPFCPHRMPRSRACEWDERTIWSHRARRRCAQPKEPGSAAAVLRPVCGRASCPTLRQATYSGQAGLSLPGRGPKTWRTRLHIATLQAHTRNPWAGPNQPFLSLSRFLSLKGFTPSTLSSRTQFPARACPCWQARPGTHRSDFTGPGSPGCPSEPALYSVRGEEGWSVCCQQTLGTEYTLALSEPSVPRYELGDRRQTGQNYACGNACPRRLHAP